MRIEYKDDKILKFKASNTEVFIIIDTEDYNKIIAHNSKWSVSINKYGDIVNIGTRSVISKQKISLPRLIMGCLTSLQWMDVDHIDNNTLNNMKSNLRIIEHKLNCARAVRPLGETGLRGVTLCKKSYKYIAKMRDKNGKRIHLGTFDRAEDAAKCYDENVIKLHGEFAVVNFPISAI